MSQEPEPHPKGVSEKPEPVAPATPLWRKVLVGLLKLGLAVGLFSWIVLQGHFKPEDLAGVAGHPPSIALALLLGFIGISLSGVRWTILLRGEGIGVPMLTLLKLTWIGHFWNMVFPGAVSGDAVKMFYVGKAAPELREEAWTTVLADRIIGLVALVSLSFIAALANLDLMLSRIELKAMLVFMGSILLAVAIGGVLLVLGVGRDWRVVSAVRERLPFTRILVRGYQSLHRQGRRPKRLIAAYIISLVAHCLTVTNGFVLGRAAGEAVISLTQYMVLVPLAMFSNAIPLTPGGFGIGENVLGYLFQWSGGSLGDGTNVMLLMRGVFYACAVFGAVVYTFYRRSAPKPNQ